MGVGLRHHVYGHSLCTIGKKYRKQVVIIKHCKSDLRVRMANTPVPYLHQLSGPDESNPEKAKESNAPIGLVEIMDRKGSTHPKRKRRNHGSLRLCLCNQH